jgi:hypothetical protein
MWCGTAIAGSGLVFAFWQNEIMFVDIVFDGPPGPESGRFVEVENERGRSVDIGEWIHRPDGLWALRISSDALAKMESDRGNPRPIG